MAVLLMCLGIALPFVKGLIGSPSMEVAVMCGVARQDIRTVTGSNLAMVRRETGLEPVLSSQGILRERLHQNIASVPDMDKWRLDYLTKMLCERGEAHYRADDKEVARLSTLIDSLCIG